MRLRNNIHIRKFLQAHFHVEGENLNTDAQPLHLDGGDKRYLEMIARTHGETFTFNSSHLDGAFSQPDIADALVLADWMIDKMDTFIPSSISFDDGIPYYAEESAVDCFVGLIEEVSPDHSDDIILHLMSCLTVERQQLNENTPASYGRRMTNERMALAQVLAEAKLTKEDLMNSVRAHFISAWEND